MSRSNSSIVKQIKREDESLNLRKKIIKSKANYTSDEVLLDLQTSDAAYVTKLEKLSKFKKKSQESTKSRNLNVDWTHEYKKLHSSANKLEEDLQKNMQSLLILQPTDVSAQELIMDDGQYKEDIQSYERSVLSQWRELKDILKQTIASISKGNTSSMIPTRTNKTSSNSAADEESSKQEGEQTSYSPWKRVLAVFADMIMQISSDHKQRWVDMERLEGNLLNDVMTDQKQIYMMLRDDYRNKLDDDILNGFDMTENERHDVATEMFMNDWILKISAMDEDHDAKMKQIQQKRIDVCLNFNIDPEDRNGGWKEIHHDIFYKIYRRSQQESISRKQLTSLLRSQLPSEISDNDIRLHEEWYRQNRMLSVQRKTIVDTYLQERRNIVEEAKKALKSFRESRQEERERLYHLQQLQEMRQDLHEKLLKMREAKQLELQSQHKILLSKQEEQRKLRELDLQRMQNEQIEKKRMVEAYLAAKKDAEEKNAELQRELREKELQERQTQNLANKEKVEERNCKFYEKYEERRRKEAEVLLEEERRAEILRQLASQVPYFDAIQNISSKLDHITASTRGHAFIPYEECEDGGKPLHKERGHIPMYGFTSSKIFKDSRFRLASALREAGVIHTDAAREAIAKFHPRPQLAIHGII